MKSQKTNLLLILITIILIILLIPLLASPEFHNGIPLPKGRFTIGDDAGVLLNNLYELVQKGILRIQDGSGAIQKTLSIIGIPISISILILIAVALLISKKIRTKVLLNLAVTLSVFLLFFFIFFSSFNEQPSTDASTELINTGDSGTVIVQEEPTENAIEEDISPRISVGISFAFSLLMILLFLGTVYVVYRKIRKARNEKPGSKLFDVTEKALQSVQSGENIPDVIIRCYRDMTSCLKVEMGIVRSAAMTPNEFQNQLIIEGLPQREISELTNLFERVRYGNRQLNSAEESAAEICLKSVLTALENR